MNVKSVILKGGRWLERKIDQQRRNYIISKKLEDFKSKKLLIPIESYAKSSNDVSEYWTGHTVHDDWFISEEESLSYRESIWDMYPYYRKFADMDRRHDGETLLDYGCGPGNDLTWYTQKTNPRMIIGIDVSRTVLENAQFRMALHGVSKEQCRLVQISETEAKIPLNDGQVDFISCQGVLMHTSYPDKILKEFHRVLNTGKDNNNACIMVYNRESIWYHLYAAYYLKYVNPMLIKCTLDETRTMDVDEIFRRSTDGSGCPLAWCWSPEVFMKMCKEAGFSKVEYQGGYANTLEPELAKKYIAEALEDERLEEEHKVFLREVRFDENGFPINGESVSCCIGGVYRLWK